jgi:signal transduction histidine kinase
MHSQDPQLIEALLGTAGVAGLRVAADGTLLSIGNEMQLRDWLPPEKPMPRTGETADVVLRLLFDDSDLERTLQSLAARCAVPGASAESLAGISSRARQRGLPPRSFDLGFLPLPGQREWLLTISESSALRSLSQALEQARSAHDLALTVLLSEPVALRGFLQRAANDVASFRALLRQPARSQAALQEKLDRLLSIVEPLRQAADALPMHGAALPLGELGAQIARLREHESPSGDDLLPLALPLDAVSTIVAAALSLDERRRAVQAASPQRASQRQALPWHEVCEQNCAELVRRSAKRHGVLATLRMRGIALVPESCHRIIELALRPMLRNAVRHGIETPPDRIAVGKPAAGKITVSFTDQGAEGIEMTVHDDGRGFDLDRIRNAAERSGLGSREELASIEPHRLVSFVFRRRFSTAGLDEEPAEDEGVAQLRQLLLRQGGTVSVATKPQRYTMFAVKLPARGAHSPAAPVASAQSAAIAR